MLAGAMVSSHRVIGERLLEELLGRLWVWGCAWGCVFWWWC